MDLLSFVVISILGPIPIFHFILHGFLKFWKTNSKLFYLTVLLIWILGGLITFFLLKIDFSLFIAPDRLIIFSKIIILFSLLLFLWSVITLGLKRFFLLSVIKPEQSQIISSGPYSLLSHPAYLAYILISISTLLITGKIVALGFNIYFIISILFVIKMEEHELSNRIIKKSV